MRFHDRDDDYRPASFTPVISVLQKKSGGGGPLKALHRPPAGSPAARPAGTHIG